MATLKPFTRISFRLLLFVCVASLQAWPGPVGVGHFGPAAASAAPAATAPELQLISKTQAGVQGNNNSASPALSADGRYTAFSSAASNLVAGDTNNNYDIFRRDNSTGEIQLVSVSSEGLQANNFSTGAAISTDGRYVAFISTASNLVPGDTNPGNIFEVFVRDMQTGLTEMASLLPDGSKNNANLEFKAREYLSADGRYVALQMMGPCPGNTFFNAHYVYLRDTQLDTTTCISRAGNALVNSIDDSVVNELVALSPDGKKLIYTTRVYDSAVSGFVLMKTYIVDTATLVAEEIGPMGFNSSMNFAEYGSLSYDGTYLAHTTALKLVPTDTNDETELYLTNILTKTTSRVAVMSTGAFAMFAHISADGNFITYSSNLPACTSPTTTTANIFLYDVQAGTTRCISPGIDGADPGHNSYNAAISEDGAVIVFDSYANNLVANDTNSAADVFLYGIPPKERYPVLIVPGIAGTYAAHAYDDYAWLLNRGAPPSSMVEDPLGHFYDDIILTLENLGYVRDQDLFVVNYDWRLLPGPDDGAIDGHVSGLTAAGISDNSFLYGVDYMGYYLRKAEEAWRTNKGSPLPKVNVIAHSTGGLVTRTYIQSDAYGGLYDGSHSLPTIDQFIMIGVPNRGASKPYNPIHDNWVADPAYQALLSKIVYRAFKKTTMGGSISGPDTTITREMILDGNGGFDPDKFINLYVPTLRALLATYDFYSNGPSDPFHDLNDDTSQRNVWALDLNNGLDLAGAPAADPNAFADLCHLTVIYGTTQNTKAFTRLMTGPAVDVVAPMHSFFTQDAALGQSYYFDVAGVANGDGTVPAISSAGQFVGDSRVTLAQMRQGVNTQFSADHTALVGNPDVQKIILNTLNVPFSDADLHTGSGASVSTVLSAISDPVEMVISDGAGRRLGYTAATGVLQEIPGSTWYGTEEGSGWLLGPVTLPLSVHLSSPAGGAYAVHLYVNTPTLRGGLSAEGVLPTGGGITLDVPMEVVYRLVFLPAIQR